MSLWLTIVSTFLWLGALSLVEREWTYELISMWSNSSNEDLIKWDLRVVRLGRGNYAFSGSVRIYTEISDIEGLSYRSVTGSSDYQLLPFSVTKQNFYVYLNGVYKQIFMKSLKNCSDFPQFEDKFEPPMEMKTYVFNKCQVSGDEFPTYLTAGYYKVILKGGGEVEWMIMAVAKVEPKVF